MSRIVVLLILFVLGCTGAFSQKVPWAGGPVIQNARIISVYWGQPEDGFQPAMDRFYSRLAGTSYLTRLSEYSTGALKPAPYNPFRSWFGAHPEQIIAGGTFAGSYVIATTGVGNVETTDIGPRLDHEIHVGNLPAPDTNTIYMVHFSKQWLLWLGTNIIGIPVGAPEGQGFSAYHAAYFSQFTGRAIIYGALPNQCDLDNQVQLRAGKAPTCTSWSSRFGSETRAASHELVEAITDPGSAVVVGGFLSVAVGSDQAWRVQRGFMDLDPDEIADDCPSGQLRTSADPQDVYTVATSWSNRVGKCLLAGPVGVLDGFYRDGSGVPHVYGWALDPERPGASIQVHIYFDGPYPQGRGFAVVASGDRADVNRVTGNPGRHGFDFEAPFQYRDGTAHSVYAYAIGVSAGNNAFLASVPKAFNARLTAQPESQPVMIASGQAPGQCLDITGWGHSPGSALQLYTCTGTDNQRFTYHPDTQQLRAYNDSSLCLDAASGFGKDGDRLILWNCEGNANQRWTFNLENGELHGVNGKCLDADRGLVSNGTALQIWTCNGGANQTWFRK